MLAILLQSWERWDEHKAGICQERMESCEDQPLENELSGKVYMDCRNERKFWVIR